MKKLKNCITLLVYIMTEYHLSNDDLFRKQLIEYIETWNLHLDLNFSDVMKCNITYDDVHECLMHTPLAVDLQNIVMTYVNDEFEIKYTISSIVEMSFSANICFQEHVLEFSYVRHYGDFLLRITKSNMLTVQWQNTIFTTHMPVINHFIHLFGQKHGVDIYSGSTIRLRFEQESKNMYVTNNGRYITYVHVINESMLSRILPVFKKIEELLSL